MTFIQIIDATTSDLDRMLAVDEEWQQRTDGKRTARRSIVARDRAHPDHYKVIVFFDDYESAMANSQLPETQEFAGKMAAVMDAPPDFTDLDVVADRSG